MGLNLAVFANWSCDFTKATTIIVKIKLWILPWSAMFLKAYSSYVLKGWVETQLFWPRRAQRVVLGPPFNKDAEASCPTGPSERYNDQFSGPGARRLGPIRCHMVWQVRQEGEEEDEEVICEKIFRSWFSPTLLGVKAGLPLQVELQRAVQDCTEMLGEEEEEEVEEEEEEEEDGTGEEGKGEQRSGNIHQHLVTLLTRLLNEGGASSEVGGAREGQGHAHTSLNF
ncbi:unnamed protein product [Arctogadus glacialis]